MRHKIKRFFQKISLFFIKRISTSDRKKLSKAEIEASIIFRKLLYNPKTELLISPISNKCYLRNNENNILVTLGSMNISIINHVFGYDVSIPSELQNKLRDLFNQAVESRRLGMEEEYKSNITHSLKEVIRGLNNAK
jgi:hypothetical protein